ncbi:MAG: hypothetical protein DMF56_11980 [Acidobacteria bacterium]|nr:MAG: hypothetical protein DMF56_11980 [Acidobacteriota bacterium]
MRPRLAAVSAVLLITLPLAAATRLTYDVNGKPTPIEWSASAFPLPYEVDQRLLELKPAFGTMIDQAFNAWASVPDANVQFSSRGIVAAAARPNDGKVVVSLADELFNGQGMLAMTTYTFDDSGHFIDADIQIDPWLLKGDFNVDTALRHEVGHVLGLDHSAVLSAVMFPYVTPGNIPTAFDSDDRIAIATTYPRFDPTLSGATLQGRVVGDSGGIFAAQVVAVNVAGEAVTTSLSNASGEFTLSGVPAGSYRIYAEPLDGPVEVKALQGTWRQAKTTSFPTTFYDAAPMRVENGRVYGNLVVNTAGAVQLNPRWIGRCNGTDVNVQTSPVVARAGDTVTLAIAGDGFVSGMTQFEIPNAAFHRISDFSWGANYVKATYTIEPDAPEGSFVVLVRSGRDTATLTGALRVQPQDTTRRRSTRH